MSDLTFVLSDPEALARFRDAVDLAVCAYGAITPRARAVLAERGVAVGVHPDDVEAVLDGYPVDPGGPGPQPPSVPPGWVRVEPGQFPMGAPRDEPGRFGDERQHVVTLTRPFLIQVCPVTNGEWAGLLQSLPGGARGGDPLAPVVNVSWYDAVWYCNALSLKEGLTPCYAYFGSNGRAAGAGFRCDRVLAAHHTGGYRLPTEAEWEYACRAGSTGPTYGAVPAIAWSRADAVRAPQRVAERAANAWGLHDVLGNVWEWCWDRYGEYPAGAVDDPTGPAQGTGRVSRGGSWVSTAASLRASLRHYSTPDWHDDTSGFRMVRSSPVSS
ncbi:MAG: hypothetical protein AMXMBFR64_33410 [Myxococcales bacterium]